MVVTFLPISDKKTVEVTGEVAGEVTMEVTMEVTGEVTREVGRLLAAVSGAMSRLEIQAVLNLKHEDHFRAAYLVPALHAGLIEMTIPDKPKSRLQKYRLTKKGKAWFDKYIGKGK